MKSTIDKELINDATHIEIVANQVRLYNNTKLIGRYEIIERTYIPNEYGLISVITDLFELEVHPIDNNNRGYVTSLTFA